MTALALLRRVASAGAVAVMALTLMSSMSRAQQSFPSPEDAAAALAAAKPGGGAAASARMAGQSRAAHAVR